MFRSLFFATTAAILAGVLAGCGSKPLPPAEAIAFADRCDPRFDEQIVKGDSVFQRVTLEGTLDIPRVRVSGSRLGSKADGVCALTHVEKIEAN